jgi:hypothetical protein
MHSHDLNNVLPEGRETKQLTGMVHLKLSGEFGRHNLASAGVGHCTVFRMHSHDLNNVLPEGRETKRSTGIAQLELPGEFNRQNLSCRCWCWTLYGLPNAFS